jgi:hypothetical protein
MGKDVEPLRQQAEAQMREWRGRLQDWQAKLDQHRLEGEQEGRLVVLDLRRRVDELGAELDRLEHQGRDAGEDLKRQFEAAWSDLREGFERAGQRLDA